MRKLFILLCAAVLLTGCVSSRTYKDTLETSEARQQKIDDLTTKLAAEKAAHESLKGELADLKTEKEKEASDLNARITGLEDQVKGLTQAGVEKDTQRASLDEKLTAETQQNEYLNREVDRLKIKTGEISSAKEKELANVKSTYENLVAELKGEIAQGDVKITQAVDRLSVDLVEKILFDSGKAEIKPEGLGILKRVGDILKNVKDKQIRVEGHTDNVRIGPRIKSVYPTNWELSTARATNVVRYLQDTVGIDPSMLSAAGFSEYKPVESNATAEGRAKNRRIEIVLLPQNVDRVLEELKK